MKALQPTEGGSAPDVPALAPERRQEPQTLLSDLLHRLDVGSQSTRGNTFFLFNLFDIMKSWTISLLAECEPFLKCPPLPHCKAHTRHDLKFSFASTCFCWSWLLYTASYHQLGDFLTFQTIFDPFLWRVQDVDENKQIFPCLPATCPTIALAASTGTSSKAWATWSDCRLLLLWRCPLCTSCSAWNQLWLMVRVLFCRNLSGNIFPSLTQGTFDSLVSLKLL